MNDRELIRFLEEKVAHLTEEKRAAMNALDLAASLGNFQTSLNKLDDPALVLRETALKLQTLVQFKVLSFYLVNEDDSDFYLAYCNPVDFSDFIEKEMELLIIDNTFNWALGRNKPVIVTSSDKKSRIFLHTLATASRVRGMFVGLLDKDQQDIFDVYTSLLSTIFFASAHALESYELYGRIRVINKQLETNIEKLKKSEQELLGHRENLEREVKKRTKELELINIHLKGEILERKKIELALRDSEERYRSLFDNAADAIYVFDLDGKILDANIVASQHLGYTRDELLNLKFMDLLPEEEKNKNRKYVDEVKHNYRVFYETRHLRNDGKEYPVEINSKKIIFGKSSAVLAIARNISERRQAEQALKLSEEKYRHLVENINDVMYTVDTQGIVTYISPVIEKISQYKPEEIIGRKFTDFAAPEEIPGLEEKFMQVLKGDLQDYEFKVFAKNGATIYVSSSSAPDTEDGGIKGITGILTDVTERKQAEENLKKSLKEKEILLKEIHHRVKNNLQIISSLLQLQSAYVKHPEDLELFVESQNRITTMALVHEELYQSDTIAKIDFYEYTDKILNKMFNVFAENKEVSKAIDVDNIYFTIDTAIPCGLIITELVTNALKYAFPGGRKGVVTVSIKKENEHITLVVMDDGVGFPEDLDFRNTETLGLQLVMSLVGQLNGDIELKSDHGAEFIVRFKEA